MANLTAYVAGPYQGVSQAPPQDRLPEACEAMEDCLCTIPHGTQKRPPFRLVGVLAGVAIGASPLWVEIPRGSPAADVTLLVNRDGDGVIRPRIYSALDGSALPLVITPAAYAYLNASGASLPNQDLRTVSIEDYVFITNRKVTVTNSSAFAPTRPYETLIQVKTGAYGRNYNVQVLPTGGTSVQANYRPANGTTAADALTVGTSVISGELVTGATPPAGGNFSGTALNALSTQGFNINVTGSVIAVSHPSNDYRVLTSDDTGDQAMYAVKGLVQEFSQLPAVGVPGFTVRVAQSLAGGDSDYYVKYVTQGLQQVGGVWQECIAPGAPLGLDPSTMPIAITFNSGTGVWLCDAAPWTQRTTGDATLSPDPGFIGDQITDVKWWRGRLALIYNGGVSLSASDSPFKFYTTTLAAALDSDPIGLLTPAERKTFFKQALTFDSRFFVMADRVQAAISSGNSPVAPGSTSIQTIAQSAFSDRSLAQQGNHKVRYLAERTSSSIVYLLAIDRISGLALEEDKSTAIPQYIPPTIDCAATWEADYFTIWGTSGGTDLYVANYREDNYQEVQNSFSRWHTPIGFTLGGMYFKLGVLYALLRRNDNGYGYFCTLDITPDVIPQGADGATSTIPQFLDFMLQDLSIPFATGTSRVTLRAPFTDASGNFYPEGYILQNPSDPKWAGAPRWYGLLYGSYFIPTRWYVLGADKKPQHDGRLSLKRLKADVANYGYLRAEVSQQGRALRSYPFEAYLADSPPDPTLDAPSVQPTAVLNVPLAGNAEDLSVKFINDSHLGFKLLGYEWRGDWNPNSRRTT